MKGTGRVDGVAMDAGERQLAEGLRQLTERREFLLESLRDLDDEHRAGDIDDADYTTLRADYTARAAAVLKALADPPPVDVAPGPGPWPSSEAVPLLEDTASGAATEPLSEDAASEAAAVEPSAEAGAVAVGAGRARRRVLVGAAAVIVGAGVAYAVVASSSPRAPGEIISGQAIGAAAQAQLLVQAQKAANTGHAVTAIRDDRTILATDPTQPQALTMEGWLLAQTQQPALLRQGIGLLTAAERSDAAYAPAHVYRGIALLSEGNDAAAVPELRWYLAHHPDPALASRIRTALARAQAAVAAPRAPATTVPATTVSPTTVPATTMPGAG